MVVFLTQTLAQRLLLHLLQFHPLQLAPVVFFLPPTGADIRLTLRQLALCGGGFLVVVVVVVNVYVCSGGGCSYGVVVVGKCIAVVQRLASSKVTQTSSKESGHSTNCYIMVHKQSACTHTSFAHAVALFQLALVSDGISKSQVANHLKHTVVVKSCVCLRCFSVIYGCGPLWESYLCFHLLT